MIPNTDSIFFVFSLYLTFVLGFVLQGGVQDLEVEDPALVRTHHRVPREPGQLTVVTCAKTTTRLVKSSVADSGSAFFGSWTHPDTPPKSIFLRS
jgi:hypothetical protein